jgi:hypothetical protein
MAEKRQGAYLIIRHDDDHAITYYANGSDKAYASLVAVARGELGDDAEDEKDDGNAISRWEDAYDMDWLIVTDEELEAAANEPPAELFDTPPPGDLRR